MRVKSKWATLFVGFMFFFADLIPFALAATDYPNRPIELVIPFAPGGGMDIAATAFKEHVSRILGQPIVSTKKWGTNRNIL